MEQVHLYGTGTIGRPVHQSYVLTGSASEGSPRGNTRGWDPSQRQGHPAPHPASPHTHHSMVVPDTAPEEQHPRQRSQEKEWGGHAKGAAGEHTTTTRPQPGVAGNHIHSPHTHTEPPTQAQRGEGRHPNAPPTHQTHTLARTQHTPPRLPPTQAPQTHTTHKSASTARTTNAHNTGHGKELNNPPPGEVKGRQKDH